jgi:hypothetical protein
MYRSSSIVGSTSYELDRCCRGIEEEEPGPVFSESHRLIDGVPRYLVSFSATEAGEESARDFILGCKTPRRGEAAIPFSFLAEEDMTVDDLKFGSIFSLGFDAPTAEAILRYGEAERMKLATEAIVGSTVNLSLVAA